jgi:hypothetical protein
VEKRSVFHHSCGRHAIEARECKLLLWWKALRFSTLQTSTLQTSIVQTAALQTSTLPTSAVQS